MATHKSNQITNADSVPVTFNQGNTAQKPTRLYFDFTTPAGTVATSDTIQLVKIPAGARIVGGLACWEAMSTAGGAATMALGDGTTADKYLAATSVDAAGSAVFATTVATFYGQVLTAETTLTATASVEAWAAAKLLKGHIDFLI